MSDPDAPSYWDQPDPEPKTSPVREDTAALLVFARELRGIAWSTQLGAAMRAADDAKWTWLRAARIALQLVLDAEAEPLMLTEAVRNPVNRREASAPNTDWQQARMELERKVAGR